MVRVACGRGVSLVRDGIDGIGEKGNVETLRVHEHLKPKKPCEMASFHNLS